MKAMPFAAAIEHFRGKSVLDPAEFAALAEEIGDWAGQRAFTVARVARADVLNDMYSAVLDAIEEGKTLFEFREEIDRIMEVRGWDGLSPHRLDNILRTNTQAAYNAGRFKQMKRVAERRPYWQYDAVNDRFTRPSHAAHDGKVYDHRHPFWSTWFPPNGYRCFPPYVRVLTPSGWKEIGTILGDDWVIGGSGEKKRVTAIHRNRFNGELVSLIFEDGRIDATPNHRVLTMRGWVRADELNTCDVLVETVPQPTVDALVCDEDLADSQGGNGGMPIPVERESAMSFAADPEVQLGDENVQPLGANGSGHDVIVNNLETEAPYVVERHRLGPGRGHLARHMLSGVSADHAPVSGGIPLPHFGAPGRGGLFESFGEIVRSRVDELGLASVPVEPLPLPLQIELSQLLGGICSALGGGMQPLGFDRLAAVPGLYSEVLEESHQGASVEPPSLAEGPIGELFSAVQPVQGLGSGTPLDRFDTLDGFRAWARSHCSLRRVVDIQRVPYTGIVGNLSVETDESFIIQGATVHNCRCRVTSLSAEELAEEGLTVETRGTDFKPDKGFANSPEEPWRPDTTKYPPQLQRQVEEAIFD